MTVNAYLGEEGKPFHGGIREHGLSGNILDEPYDDTRKNHSYDLRQAEFFSEEREKFGNKEYQSQRQQQFVDIHILHLP